MIYFGREMVGRLVISTERWLEMRYFDREIGHFDREMGGDEVF